MQGLLRALQARSPCFTYSPSAEQVGRSAAHAARGAAPSEPLAKHGPRSARLARAQRRRGHPLGNGQPLQDLRQGRIPRRPRAGGEHRLAQRGARRGPHCERRRRRQPRRELAGEVRRARARGAAPRTAAPPRSTAAARPRRGRRRHAPRCAPAPPARSGCAANGLRHVSASVVVTSSAAPSSMGFFAARLVSGPSSCCGYNQT